MAFPVIRTYKYTHIKYYHILIICIVKMIENHFRFSINLSKRMKYLNTEVLMKSL